MSISTFIVNGLRTPLASVSLLALAVGMPMIAGPAFAQDSERPTVSKKKPATAGSTVALVNILVEQGVITQEQGQNLIKQADDEAYVARQAARDANAKATEAAATAAAAAAAASPPGSKRVTYVPDIVKRELREEIRQEVMAKAKDEGWASPGKYPEWASRIRIYGDIRGRWEGMWYPSGYSSGEMIDFNAINTGSPYDVSAANLKGYPTYNGSESRNRYRMRARLGLEADLAEGFIGGLRIATGSDSSPVSTNQTLGRSGGNFSKYALWLDRAFIKFEPFKNPHIGPNPDFAPDSVSLTFGRFDNPFWSPTDLVWDSDLGFDGLAINAKREVSPGFTPFFAAGAMPIFNTDLDFSTTEKEKFKSTDKYLFGGQIGFNWQATPQVGLTLGAGIYDYTNVQGKKSSPCDVSISQNCDTDNLRPSFAQKGNTYGYLRDIVPPPGWNGSDPYANPQYFGLASDFRPVVISGRVDLNHFDPIHVAIDGEFVWNSAFNRAEIEQNYVNNYSGTPGKSGKFEGGNIGWTTKVTVGHQKLDEYGKWSVNLGYKYLESDATLDAFADSDFGLGGTNLKGYFLGGSRAFWDSVSGTAKWMSATSIAGVPYAVDLLQFDVNAKF